MNLIPVFASLHVQPSGFGRWEIFSIYFCRHLWVAKRGKIPITDSLQAEEGAGQKKLLFARTGWNMMKLEGVFEARPSGLVAGAKSQSKAEEKCLQIFDGGSGRAATSVLR